MLQLAGLWGQLCTVMVITLLGLGFCCVLISRQLLLLGMNCLCGEPMICRLWSLLALFQCLFTKVYKAMM